MEQEPKNYTPYPLPSPSNPNKYAGLIVFAVSILILGVILGGAFSMKGSSTVGGSVTPEPTLDFGPQHQSQQQRQLSKPHVEGVYTSITPSPSVTPKVTPTHTPTPTPSSTPIPTPTDTPVPTATPTNTPTPTPTPTNTPTPTATSTPTPTPTSTPIPTSTPTPSITP